MLRFEGIFINRIHYKQFTVCDCRLDRIKIKKPAQEAIQGRLHGVLEYFQTAGNPIKGDMVTLL